MPQDPSRPSVACGPHGLTRLARKAVIAVGVSCAGLLLIVLALAWTMPAATVARIVDLPPQVLALDGSLRQGQARLDGGYRLEWTVSGVFAFGITATVTVTGPDTRLDGVVMVGSGTLGVRDLTGRAGSGLLALAPGLKLDCDSRVNVDVVLARWSDERVRAQGRAQIAEGVCRAGPRTVPLPASEVVLSEEGPSAVATVRSLSGTEFGSLLIGPARRATLTVEPQGAAFVTGTASSTALILELSF